MSWLRTRFAPSPTGMFHVDNARSTQPGAQGTK